ncbi:hypothetical protein AX16_000103 [Volvariella volvacea WC 439]|nr:hypothetical protein AX16_000103 [Volvariella volvacea WC 439]
MKFGKHIQAQQIPGWSAYYLDYKFLKKIISSLAANRPASEAASLALGVRPSDVLTQSPASAPVASPAPITRTPPTSALLDDATSSTSRLPIFATTGQDEDRTPDFRAHKAAFFFKLERELEKINLFYLQKEAELKLRLETLLSKRRAAAMRGLPDLNEETSVEWSAVAEGFRLLERDLNKLQQFVEINATGFRKILKKFDKRSKSTTKELYLTRQVDVQPVFNRQLISELADAVTACLMDLTDLSSGLKFEGTAASDILTQQILLERSLPAGPYYDLEVNLRTAVANADNTAITDCVKLADTLAHHSATNVARILWNIIIEAPPDLADLILASLVSPFDFRFIDDINGRTCLHEAARAGTPRLVDMCLQNGVQHLKTDLYGRTALHYAAMNGHANICRRLLEAGLPADSLDRDNYTPLIYATQRGAVECVRVLLEVGHVSVQPEKPAGDLIPLSLASQAGHLDVVHILLEYGAECLANSNGEYPMHLAAREGHVEVCRVLLHREGWDTPDKYQEWTPVFHAARYGRDECVELLLQAGARALILDELGLLAVHYAAWYGHNACLASLSKATLSVPGPIHSIRREDSPMSDAGKPGDSEIDTIPSLTLPPPIMPHRVYGHNYLDRHHLVQITIGHFTPDDVQKTGVRLHHRLMNPAFKDDHLLTSPPLKLVMTCPNITSAPYSISLPHKIGEGIFVFQIPSLDSLSLEFSIHPNFGTKTLGRAVALPSWFHGITNSAYNLPILDSRMHVVGEVDFEVNIITAFEGVTLEVGGDVETYWKAMAAPVISTSQLLVPRASHRSSLISSAHTSPSTFSISSVVGRPPLTISSLHGSYFSVAVQVTKDHHPVVYAGQYLPERNFELSVSDVTLAQFEALAKREGRQLESNPQIATGDWPSRIQRSMLSLAQLLTVLPLGVGINLDLTYPSKRKCNLNARFRSNSMDLNTFVDSILRAIHCTSASLESYSVNRRRIVFTSFSPDVCSALNWKQPNYPVFFATLCGKNRTPPLSGLSAEELKCDSRNLSIGAAVEFAKVNNLLGIFVEADLLVQVPSLINGVRNAGLLVGVHSCTGQFTTQGIPTMASGEAASVDAFLGDDGMVTFVDHAVRELF